MVMGNSPGSFGTRLLSSVGPRPVQIEKGDFNRDGKLDLALLSVGVAAAGEEYGQSLYVLEGLGTGEFKPPFVTALVTTDAEAHFSVGDFDGDTWLDLALLEPSGNRIRLALNRGSAAPLGFREAAAPVTVGTGARRVAAGDFTEDGNSDLAVAFVTQEGGAVEIFVSDGVESATPAGRATLEGPPTCIRAAHIDADESLDIALGCEDGAGSGRAYVVRGDGDGALESAGSTDLTGVPSDVAVGDLDADGVGDLALTLPEVNTLSSVLVKPLSGARGVFVRGDANGEGLIDVSDGVSALGFLFSGGTTDCLEALDANDDFKVDVTDPIYLLNYSFLGGPSPPPPFPEPGKDPAEPTLGCEREA